MDLYIHDVAPRSRANGPGRRFVIWFQGCSLGCRGCFNPGTHRFDGGRRVTVSAVIADIAAAARAIDGVTLSGGEPMQQPEATLQLARGIRHIDGMSVVMFSGYTIEEIRDMPLGRAILSVLDVVIDGRYQASSPLGRGLRGSQNQRIHLLSDRYSAADIAATPEAEIHIGPGGAVTLTGITPLKLKGSSPA